MTAGTNGASMRTAVDIVATKLGHQSRYEINSCGARLIRALLQRPRVREAVERIAGVSNGPDIVSNMAISLGIKNFMRAVRFRRPRRTDLPTGQIHDPAGVAREGHEVAGRIAPGRRRYGQ